MWGNATKPQEFPDPLPTSASEVTPPKVILTLKSGPQFGTKVYNCLMGNDWPIFEHINQTLVFYLIICILGDHFNWNTISLSQWLEEIETKLLVDLRRTLNVSLNLTCSLQQSGRL